jgi:hypothetical protein
MKICECDEDFIDEDGICKKCEEDFEKEMAFHFREYKKYSAYDQDNNLIDVRQPNIKLLIRN